MALDVVADAAPQRLALQPMFVVPLGIGRHLQLYRGVAQAEEDRIARLLRQVLPRSIEVEFQYLRHGVDQVADPLVGSVSEGLADKAATANAALGVGHQQIREKINRVRKKIDRLM